MVEWCRSEQYLYAAKIVKMVVYGVFLVAVVEAVVSPNKVQPLESGWEHWVSAWNGR
jgi:hypothetical protein